MAEYISQRYVNMQVLYPINSIIEIYSVYTVILQDGIIFRNPDTPFEWLGRLTGFHIYVILCMIIQWQFM